MFYGILEGAGWLLGVVLGTRLKANISPISWSFSLKVVECPLYPEFLSNPPHTALQSIQCSLSSQKNFECTLALESLKQFIITSSSNPFELRKKIQRVKLGAKKRKCKSGHKSKSKASFKFSCHCFPNIQVQVSVQKLDQVYFTRFKQLHKFNSMTVKTCIFYGFEFGIP